MTDAVVRPGRPEDVAAADATMKAAFAAHLGLADPNDVIGDASLVAPRAAAHPDGFVVAERDGQLIGSAIGMRWGSLLVVAPVTVQPDLRRLGIGFRLVQQLLAQVPDAEHAGLFTWPDSPGHVRLYQALGFWPRFPTFVLRLHPRAGPPPAVYSALDADGRRAAEDACLAIAETALPGLDLTREMRGARELAVGETLLTDGGFAVCHRGPGSEAGSGRCLVKFAAVVPGEGAAERLHTLLDACEAFAVDTGAEILEAGVSVARREAYRLLLARGMRVALGGLAMHRERAVGGLPGASGDDPITCRPGVFVLDDWR